MEFWTYQTYQDVRKNLFLYGIVATNIAGFVLLYAVFPRAWADAFQQAVLSISKLAGTDKLSAMLIFTIVAFFLIEVVKIHDLVYDRHVIRWREQYALDFILPRLCSPFLDRLHRRFFEEATAHLAVFMERLYYPFVGDLEPKIAKNKLVRFYERVTIYWMTQYTEILIVLLVTVAAGDGLNSL